MCLPLYHTHTSWQEKTFILVLLLGMSSFCSIFSFAFPIQTTWCCLGNFCLFINYAYICSWIHVHKNQHVFWNEKTKHTCKNRRAFCMRMRQYGLLKCHRGILCELFTFSTSICRLFSGAEWRVLSATFHKHVLYGIVVFLGWKWVYCSLAVALERTVFPFVKQCIEDKMAAECSYDLTFRAHFLSRRKRSVC